MHKLLVIGALLGSVWALVGPWLPVDPAVAAAGHMMSGQAAGGGMMDAGAPQLFGTTVTTSTYFWHFVPGIIGIALAVVLLAASSRSVRRLSAVGLIAAGVWVTFGPWVLPSFGMGDPMTMGLTFGTLVRHAGPGLLILLAAIGSLLTLPRPVARAATSTAPARAEGR